MSIKDTYKLGMLITIELSKEGCIFLVVGGRPSHATRKHD